MWGDYENETLIHNHKLAKTYKKRYQRAGDFNSTLYNLFGLITVVSSCIASTISWSGPYQQNTDTNIFLSSVTTISAVSATIQNFYKFKETSDRYFGISKLYAKVQNEIESVGNIHPEYRTIEPIIFFKRIQDTFNNISDDRLEISNCMSKNCYHKKIDTLSYLEEKHKKYKSLSDKEKLTYTKKNIDIMETEESEEDEIEHVIIKSSFP